MRFLPIWQRHFLVWQKVAVTSILGLIMRCMPDQSMSIPTSACKQQPSC